MRDAGLLENADDHFMRAALREAELALEEEEVPVGAVVVAGGRIIARAHNQVERLQDATAHAEMLALTAAEGYLGGRVLESCTLYVTLEPCVMCAGACYWTRVGRIVVGAKDEKRGFLRHGAELLHPRTEYLDGVEGARCAELLTSWFRSRR